MLILSVLFFTLGTIFLIYGVFQIGKKSYDVKVDIDVENIIKKEVKKFLVEHKSVTKICNHKWETIQDGYITRTAGERIGKYYHMRCEKCGDMKKKNLVTDY